MGLTELVTSYQPTIIVYMLNDHNRLHYDYISLTTMVSPLQSEIPVLAQSAAQLLYSPILV